MDRFSTTEIILADVPHYLRRGSLFRSLVENEQDVPLDADCNSDHDITAGNYDDTAVLHIPTWSMKPDLKINDPNDLKFLLSTIRYWAVDELPEEVTNFVLSYGFKSTTTAAPDTDIVETDKRDTDRVEANKRDVAQIDGVTELAASEELLEMWRVVEEYKTEFPLLAALLRISSMPTSAWMEEVISMSCSVLVLSHLHEAMHIPWDIDSSSTIAATGNLACLTYAIEHGCQWDKSTCLEAARKGHLKCLQYAHEHGCPWDSHWGKTCNSAALFGHLECLRYAHKKGCHWTHHTTSCAASGGHLECLIYLHENHCPWNSSTCVEAAQRNHLHCLTYAHEHGCPWDEYATTYAALGGAFECLQYMHKNGCRWNENATMLAAQKGYIDILRYIHQNGCPWDNKTCARAALFGQLECLQYAHEHGCPWDEATCANAALNDHMDCLVYAYENGCPMGVKTVEYAVQKMHIECLRYALHCGCPVGAMNPAVLSDLVGETVRIKYISGTTAAAGVGGGNVADVTGTGTAVAYDVAVSDMRPVATRRRWWRWCCCWSSNRSMSCTII